VRALVEAVLARHGRLDAVIHCVGRSARAAAHTTPPEAFRELWEINFLTAVHCAAAVRPALATSRGSLVLIGSLASKMAGWHLGAYPASKFALAAYAQQLRLELAPQGIHVLLVCPGPIRREDAGQRYAAQAAGLPPAAAQPGGGVRLRGVDPQRLARQILAACQRRQPELVVPASARLLFALAQLSPRLGDWIMTRMIRSS
jgi:NAD(P)-dependent dehydrogenase (short-subunit alcohol dehydrogenase family)